MHELITIPLQRETIIQLYKEEGEKGRGNVLFMKGVLEIMLLYGIMHATCEVGQKKHLTDGALLRRKLELAVSL